MIMFHDIQYKVLKTEGIAYEILLLIRETTWCQYATNQTRLLMLRVFFHIAFSTISHHIQGLVQYVSNSIANALELLQSCTKPSTIVGWLYWL